MTTNNTLTVPSATAAAGHQLLISLGRSASDAHPTRTECTWPRFVSYLLDQCPRAAAGITLDEYAHLKSFPSKSPEGQRLHADKDGPYVVLSDFGGHARKLDTLLASYGVPLDFDSGHVNEAVIRATLQGYAYAAYTSYAHQPGAERWRVFVPVARPMTADEHYATWQMLSNAFVGGADPAAKDPTRLSYLPGKCLMPDAARIIHVDGAFLQPAPVIASAPSVVQVQTDGPVPGWAGPSDEDELIRKGCEMTTRPDERFGGPVHFAMLWSANEDWLAAKFPPDASEQGQTYSRTRADMALAGELAYLTGSDRERMGRLMLASGLARDDDDWRERKMWRAVDEAVRTKKQWAFMQPSVPTGTTPDAYTTLVDRTDTGNANLLIAQVNGTLRYVAETKQWLRWTGTRWQLDEHEVFANASALEVAKMYMHEARRLEAAGRSDLAETQAKWAAKCRNKTTLDAMLVQARKANGVPISVKELDRDPLLLGVENGVVDLRTGELRPDAREDFITKRCSVRYEPSATAPRWESFIVEITGAPIPPERDAAGEVIRSTVGQFTPRPELASYLHKALGYAITGLTKEQKFFIAIGEGSNGKSVVFDTVKSILGPYAFTLPSEAFVAAARGADSERPTALAASLAGTRFVVASETKEGQRLDISVVKNHTGDKEMTARRMRENPITFAITHKPWLCTNAPPALDHMDPATRGRLHVIPFDRRWNRPGEYDWNPALPDGDKDLGGHLEHEAEGILAWLVRGAVLYQREGLKPPQEVVALTRDYVMEQDHFSRWLAGLQRCPAREGTYAAELFSQFAAWCAGEAAAVSPATQKAFSTALKKRSVDTFDDMRGKRYGLRTVLPSAPPPPALVGGIDPAVVFGRAAPPPPPTA